MNKCVAIQERETGKYYFAQYAANSRGNMRYWVNGKFYSDKSFDKKFRLLAEDEKIKVSLFID